MKTFKLKKTSIFFMAFTILALAYSCSKDNDVLYSKELKVYVSTRTPRVNFFEVQITHTPVSSKFSKGNQRIEFPIQATRNILTDIEATFEDDTSLVAEYNTKNKTKYKVLPKANYTFKNGKKLLMKAGEAISLELFKIEINGIENLKDKAGYLIPIRLNTITSKDVGTQLSTKLNTVYVGIDIRSSNIESTTVKVDGTFLDRTGWNAKLSDGKIINTVFDGNINNNDWYDYIRFGKYHDHVLIDMQSEQSFKGIRLAPVYRFGRTYILKRIELFTSNDGKQWNRLGMAELPKIFGSASSPEYQYIKLYNEVKVRYIKIKFHEFYNMYYSISEFDLIN